MLRRWLEEVAVAKHCIARTGAVDACVPPEWARVTAGLRSLDRRAMLDALNRAINRHPYVAAVANWGRPDYWETPFEFMARNGQCEDYAIAKFMILRALGFADSELRILVVRDAAREVDHAVLVVDLDGTAWLLDSIDDTVAPLATATRYQPYYAINENRLVALYAKPLGNPLQGHFVATRGIYHPLVITSRISLPCQH